MNSVVSAASMIPERHRLRSTRAIAQLFGQGRRVYGKYMKVVAAPTHFPYPRIAIVAGLAVDKRATRRNRVRRQIREIMREVLKQGRIRGGVDIGILLNSQAVGKTRKMLAQDLFFACVKAKILHKAW